MKSVWSKMTAAMAAGLVSISATAQISDLTGWTLLEDPPTDFLSTFMPTSNSITLVAASGPVPNAADIGYASVNAATASVSAAGFAFDRDRDFAVAVDFEVLFDVDPVGGLAFGFGVGADASGRDSAGVGVLTSDGLTSGPVTGAARIDDVTQLPQFVNFNAITQGSFFTSYEAATGNVTVGANDSPGATTGFATTTFLAIQNQWAQEDLLLSFFIRSDDTLGTAWQGGGRARATFSNFRVLEGEAITIPEPTSALLLVTAGAGLLRRRRA